MRAEEIKALLESQKNYFESGATLPIKSRLAALRRLRDEIRNRSEDILSALRCDLGKSGMEGYMCEVGLALNGIGYMLSHLKKFAKARRAKTPLAQFSAKSYQKATPRGNVLIISPWNYPFLLSIEPLAEAVAAGNTVIVKPSAYSPATSQIIVEIIEACFSKEHVAVVTGGRAENTCLLEEKFDFIFFTGSQAVGKEVMRKAAETLTPIALELGGKSPCIVDETANIPLAAKRIVFGKYLNCGQTCVAPDFVLCHKAVKERLVNEIKKQIRLQFGEEPIQNPDYGKMINEKHFERVSGLILPEKTVYGGGRCALSLKIEPTVMDEVAWSDSVMQEEIFGPVLPILSFDNFEDLPSLLFGKQKPLALYYFTADKKRAAYIVDKIPFGGGCINDTIIHLATHEMPFGGVGESGMGAYHGKTGFDLFSHVKSVVDKKTWIDLPMRYQPYTNRKEKMVKKFLK